METQNPFVNCSEGGTLLKILFGASVIGIPQQVEISRVGLEMAQMEMLEGHLKNDMIAL